MLITDRDALICDLAETYGIFDYRVLQVPLLATLAAGLREDSRIKMRLSGVSIPRSDLLLAAAVDRLSALMWFQSKDGQKGANRPASILSVLLGQPQEDGGEVEAFETADEFESEWRRITGATHG